MMVASVLTQHNDKQRTGHNPNEDKLNWSNVNSNSFGKICEHSVSGFICAQPLFVPNVHVAGRGLLDLVIVCTMENYVYAFDAAAESDGASACLWMHHLGGLVPVPSNALGVGYGDMHGSNIGILSTPVIDAEVGTADQPTVGTIYVVAMGWRPEVFDKAPSDAFEHRLFALDIATGNLRDVEEGCASSVKIDGQVFGKGYLAENRIRQARREGRLNVLDADIAKDRAAASCTALASSTDLSEDRRKWPIVDGVKTGRLDRVVFNSMQHLQRPGLLLHEGIIYTAFGAHADFDPYHGWVFAHDAQTLTRRGIFCSTKNGSQGGIWQAGEGLSVDENGYVYAGTGNGDTSSAHSNYGESLLKLKLGQEGLQLIGFTNVFVDPVGGDEDFGSSSPTMLPGGLMVGGGKDGNFYLINPKCMDAQGSPGSIVQTFLASADYKSRPNASRHIHGSPIVFSTDRETFVYVWGENDFLRCFRYDPLSTCFPDQPNGWNIPGIPAAMGSIQASADGKPDSMPGAFLSVSSDQGKPQTAIVWASYPPYGSANQTTTRGELRAFKADEFESGRLVSIWSSRCVRERDDYGVFPKFCCPTIAAGRVYQATFSHPGTLVVYGLLPHANYDYDLKFIDRDSLVFNGSASVFDGKVRLVEFPHVRQAGSVFCRDKVDVGSITSEFTFAVSDYQPPNSSSEFGAQGFTFCVQSTSPYALGSQSSGFGYGPDVQSPADRGAKICQSVALRFGFTNNDLGLQINGKTPDKQHFNNRSKVKFTSGQSIVVSISYHENNLKVSLREKNSSLDSIESFCFNVEIYSHVGCDAHIGFTAGSSQRTHTLDILEWSLNPLQSSP